MHDLRHITALRQLADLCPEADPPDWAWAVARLEPSGRLLLPVEARAALGARQRRRRQIRGICHRAALVVSSDGEGRPMLIDDRGRVYLPAWPRRGPVAGLLVGAHAATSTVVIASISVLDWLGDRLAGDGR